MNAGRSLHGPYINGPRVGNEYLSWQSTCDELDLAY